MIIIKLHRISQIEIAYQIRYDKIKSMIDNEI
jgi:hypothetical protein